MIRALLIVLILPLTAQAQQVDSVYSSHDWARDCESVEPSAIIPPDEAAMGGKIFCPGPNGMQVMLADGDLRISMDYGNALRFGPWESFGTFSDVHETIEWRRQPLDGEMQPFATIHRWIVGPSGDTREILVVSTVATGPENESCMVGFIDTTNTPEANRLARAVADRYARGFVCGNARSRGFGYVSLETPVPRRVAAQ
jgi:hypothetical protein